MILVRDVLQVKFGQMDNILAALIASASSSQTSTVSRILTDLSGQYFTLVVETKAESMDAYWEALQASFTDPEQQEQMSPFGEFVESGHREFFTIEFEA